MARRLGATSGTRLLLFFWSVHVGILNTADTYPEIDKQTIHTTNINIPHRNEIGKDYVLIPYTTDYRIWKKRTTDVELPQNHQK